MTLIKDVFTPIQFRGSKYSIRHIELKKKRKGTPIVFLSGIGGFAESYQWNFEGFYQQNYWPMAVDHIGFGKSDKPDTEEFTHEIFSIAIKEWALKNKLKDFVLVGNSFGGGVAVGVWELISDKIASVVLVSSAGYGRELLWNYRIASLPVLNEIIIYLAINKFLPINNGKRSWRSIINDYESINEDFLKLSDHYKDDHEIRRAYSYILKNLVNFYGQPNKTINLITAISRKMRDKEVPVLIIWGRNDKVIPLSHGINAKLLTNGKLKLIDRCGHMPYFEYPIKFNEIVINFLKNNKTNGRKKTKR